MRDEHDRVAALAAFWPAQGGLLVQAPASGAYCKVQVPFDESATVAASTSDSSYTHGT